MQGGQQDIVGGIMMKSVTIGEGRTQHSQCNPRHAFNTTVLQEVQPMLCVVLAASNIGNVTKSTMRQCRCALLLEPAKD